MTDGAIVQVAHDRIVYRASSLGSCTKALAAARLEYTPLSPPEGIAAVFRRGHEYEEIAVNKLRDQGWLIVGRQAEVVLPITKQIVVVGHVDGFGKRLEGGTQLVAVDVKSQTQEAWDAFEKNGWESTFFPKYKWQFSAYGLASQVLCMLVRINVETEEVKCEPPFEPFYDLSTIRAKVLQAEAIAVNGVLPAECDNRMFPCPYFYLHEDNETVTLTDPDVERLAREHEEQKVAEKVAKQKKETARKALREAVGDDRRTQTMSGVKVTFYDQKNPPSLNRERLQATAKFLTGQDFNLDAYQDQTSGERLRITLPKEKDGDDG